MSTPGELLEALGREARARFGGSGEGATRVYRGRSVDELVPQIQRDLGSDAIIVRRREGLTGGVLGFFQRQYVEIEAMPGAPGVDVYDEHVSAAPPSPAEGFVPDPAPAPQYRPAPAPQPPPPPPPPPPPAAGAPAASAPAASTPAASTPAASAPAASAPANLAFTPALPVQQAPASSPPSAAAAAPPPFLEREPVVPAAKAGSAYVTAHLAALARADRSKLPPRAPTSATLPDGEPSSSWSAELQELSAAAEPGEAFQRPTPRAAAAPWSTEERRVVAPGSQVRARAGVARSLARCGIGEQLTEELLDGASAHALALAPRGGLAQAVRTTLAQRIPVAPPLPSSGAAIVVVGAGGAGKTACCAALLGAYRKSSSLSASFATITREPSRGELRMLLSPYVMKPSAAAAPRALRALRRARNDGVAVLDTPSVSPSDRASVRELAKLLAEMQPERVVVALPATLGAAAAAQLLQALKPLGANAMAITHADETDQLGVAVEAACRFGLAPEYMLERARAGGWRLAPVTPGALAERLLP
jgi:flagellar biosynthesis GTPase FlhF